MDHKIALVTGFSGQLGGYLSKLLLDKNYRVYGMVRSINRIDSNFIADSGLQEVQLIEGDVLDGNGLIDIIKEIKPNECYNLAANSHVGYSFQHAEYTVETTGVGALRLLEAIRLYNPSTRFLQAGSSDQWGNIKDVFRNEQTCFSPMSPYGAAKVLAYNFVKMYREAYGIYGCTALMSNNESPRRSNRFVTRKITEWIGKYANGYIMPNLKLGYLDAKRDWGDAKSYSEAMFLMLQQPNPKDYAIGTGIARSVREFCEIAFKRANIDIEWYGKGINERGLDRKTKDVLIEIDPKLYRPTDVPEMTIDSRLAKSELGWKPQMSFHDLVYWMVDEDIRIYKL